MGRLKFVVAVTDIDSYYLASSDVTSHLEDVGIDDMLPHSGETQFVSSNRKSRYFSKTHENTGLVLERCHA